MLPRRFELVILDHEKGTAPRSIRIRRSVLYFTMASAVALYTALMIGLFFWQNESPAITSQTQARIDAMENRNHQLEQTNAELVGRVNDLQRQLETRDALTADLHTTIDRQSKEMVDLRQELTFYRNILESAAQHDSLEVYGFQLVREEGWRYQFRLIQSLKRQKMISGSWQLQITYRVGEEGEEENLMEPADQAAPYGFRYFQSFEGSLAIPDGAVVTDVQITLFDRRGHILARPVLPLDTLQEEPR
ncbi:MAG: hypothetical protein COX57_10910 [Alphaproteobacteria bacterium CG_4_10_14_0_2_um_filter_63_37]|nr:MAG: hypothetical protein AUJ55_09415 [Proteobacteria bacterium CG1_02_64_396]PJA23956.1 MAG: hypothetical protein COX57_10910 [Alphaproteobacteria bacterium CG_4_10_14_0_2_um_filter_63_37]